MFIALAIVGLIVIVASASAAAYVSRTFRLTGPGRSWCIAPIAAWVLGIALGVALLKTEYHHSATVRIVGFPFLVAVFELHNGHWNDFVGPLTLPAAAGNFVVGLLFPQLILALILRFKNKSSPPTG